MTDSIKKSKFYRGLHDEVKDALVGQVSGTETFEEYIKKCVSLDRQLEQRRLEKAGKRSGTMSTSLTATVPQKSAANANTTSVPSTQGGTQPGPMDLSSGIRKKLTDEQKQYRRANNLCLYCGESGHFASACPARPNGRPQRLAETVTTSMVIAEGANATAGASTSASASATTNTKTRVLCRHL